MKPEVSIVIVCMNNPEVLAGCLNSIIDHTSISYEVFVVAYLFSSENLKSLKNDYPQVTIIESNEIRGFSENNNLALRHVQGRYCFVINDDTFFTTPLIDSLIADFDVLPESVAVLSPNIKYPDGRDQFCGRPKIHLWGEILRLFRIDAYRNSKFVNQKGLFQSYHLMGGAFMIRTDIFREVGFFDEYYFFCPEDVALSALLNQVGYQCYVDSEQVIYHIAASSFSRTMTATMPASTKGLVHFFTSGSCFKKVAYSSALFVQLSLKIMVAFIKGLFFPKERRQSQIVILACWRSIKAIFTKETPKEIFKRYYHL